MSKLDFQSFLAKTESKLLSNMPQYNKEYKVRYILKLYKDGSISDLKLVQGNASSEILESSQKAISKSAPFAGIDIGDNEYVILDIFMGADDSNEGVLVYVKNPTYSGQKTQEIDSNKNTKQSPEPQIINLNSEDLKNLELAFSACDNFKEPLKADITVFIDKNGMIDTFRLSSSGNPEFDSAMVDAILKVQPYTTEFIGEKAVFTQQFISKGQVWNDYINKLKYDIKRNWNPINDSTSYSTIVLFKVSKNGEISNCHVVKSSGNNDKDNRAIESVNKASPLAPFPAGANLQQIDIQFTFDYNVVGKQSQGDTSKDYQSVSNITYGKILEINVKNQLLCNIDKYMKYFRGSIAYWWNPTVEKVSRKTVVSLVLSKYGNVRTLEIVDKSGSDKFDKSVLHAINRAMPFKTLPPNYSAKTLNLELIFQSNAKNTAHSALQQMLNTSHGPLKLQYEIPIK